MIGPEDDDGRKAEGGTTMKEYNAYYYSPAGNKRYALEGILAENEVAARERIEKYLKANASRYAYYEEWEKSGKLIEKVG